MKHPGPLPVRRRNGMLLIISSIFYIIHVMKYLVVLGEAFTFYLFPTFMYIKLICKQAKVFLCGFDPFCKFFTNFVQWRRLLPNFRNIAHEKRPASLPKIETFQNMGTYK